MKESQKEELRAEVNNVFKKTLQNISLMTKHLKQGVTFEEEQIISAELEGSIMEIVACDHQTENYKSVMDLIQEIKLKGSLR